MMENKKLIHKLELFETIKNSYNLLFLEDDWGSEWGDGGYKKIDLKSFNEAIIFLHMIIRDVDNIIVPTINPTKYGHIDISFIKNDYHLLISSNNNGIKWYGQEYSLNRERINITSTYDGYEKLIKWIKINLVD